MSAEVAGLISDLVRSRLVGDDAGLWDTVQELGLSSIGVPEEAGGSGGSWADLAAVVSGLAAHGSRLPVVERAVSQWALHHDAARAGDVVGTVAVVSAAEVGEGTVSATVRGVRACDGADVLVLLVNGRPDVLVVDLRAGSGVTVSPGTGLSGIEASVVELQAAPCWSAHAEPDAVLSMLALLRAASLVGAARAAYELTRTHVRTREQFGKPLVALSPVATALAAMRVDLLLASTAVTAGLEQVSSDPVQVGPDALPALLGAALSARVISAGVATRTAAQAHQLHGAIGTTQEYSLHHLTTLLWADRDADRPEQWWAHRLGALAATSGEHEVWDRLTSPVPAATDKEEART